MVWGSYHAASDGFNELGFPLLFTEAFWENVSIARKRAFCGKAWSVTWPLWWCSRCLL